MHLWHIVRAANDDGLVLAIMANRIIVGHTGALIFLDHDQQPIYALAPSAWLSVERVPEVAVDRDQPVPGDA